MSIYTRKGDDGFTSHPEAGRIPKSSPLIEVSGVFDEALSAIGFIIACTESEPYADSELEWMINCLRWCQHRLFTCAGTVFRSQVSHMMSVDDTSFLEEIINYASSITPPLNSFILPGGSELASRLHLARTAVRRLERTLVGAEQHGFSLRPEEQTFVNRLADALFACARYANHLLGVPDIPYDAEAKQII